MQQTAELTFFSESFLDDQLLPFSFRRTFDDKLIQVVPMPGQVRVQRFSLGNVLTDGLVLDELARFIEQGAMVSLLPTARTIRQTMAVVDHNCRSVWGQA